MKKQLAGSARNVRLAGFQPLLIAALYAMAFAGLFPQRSPAQQVTYLDFNAPQAALGQSSTACGSITGGPAANGVLLCLNYEAGGVDGISFISDTYPPSIDPNASTDGGKGSTNYALQLTQNAGSQTSSVWYSTPQNVAQGFTVWYAVKINPAISLQNNAFTADGLAFVIQNASGGQKDTLTNCQAANGSGSSALGGGGGCIGYGGIDNSVALEMDTFWDSQYDPYDYVTYFPYPAYVDNHMALQACGAGNPNSPAHYVGGNTSEPTSCLVMLNGAGALVSNPNTSAALPATASPVILADDNPHQVVIVYNGPNDSPANYIYIYLDPAFNPGTHTPVAGSVPLFSGPFDITQYINLSNGTAYVGFTAANGGDYEQHELMGFAFTPHNYGNANVCPPGQSTPAPCSVNMPVSFTMASTTMIGSVKVVTQGTTGLDFQPGSGGTCSGAITVGSSCTVNVTFAPIAPGLRQGAVELFDNSNNLLATQLIYGIGQGPAVAFSPLTTFVENTAPYALSGPKSVAVDAAGDIFISDPATSKVVEVGSHGTQTVGNGLEFPQGLALDGAGDLFIADNNLNEVVEVPAGCTSSGCQQTVGTGLRSQLGVAVDGAGDVFIGDFNDGEVAEVPADGSAQTVVYSPGTGTNPVSGSHPVGVAVDGAGDLFVADFGLQQVVEVPAGCTSNACQIKVGTGWSEPESVAVDAAGDVIVADAGLNAVVEVPAGCTSSGCQITLASRSQVSLGSGFQPFGATVDAQGNVYIADYGINRLDVVLQTFASLSFSASNVDNISGDSPESILFQNIGNQTLNANSLGLFINDPYANPAPDFVQVPGPGTPADCTTAFSLGPGGACNLSVDFDPQSSGAIQAVAQFFDNALNNSLSSQSVPLSGTGVAVAPPNYTLTVAETGSGPGAVTSGDGLISCTYANGNFTGTCSPSYSSGTAVTLTATPTGTATFLGWGGACSGTNPTCTVTMSSAMNVSASFSQAFGSVNACAAGQSTPSPCNSTLAVTFNITSSTTIGVVQVVTQGVTGLDFAEASGGTCSGPIAAGNPCTVNVSFTPLAPGLRMGAVNLFDSSGNLLGTALISGVGQAPEAAFGPGTQTNLPASGLAGTSGVTVDAAGDVFISDNAGAVKVTPSGVQSTVPTSGISGAYDVAVDGAGDVFLADTSNNRVVEVTPSGVQTTVPATGLSYPTGVAVDGSGDVFITDVNNNRVVKVTPSGVQTTVPTSGVIRPYYPAVDGAGDVYFLDSGNERVLKVTPGGIQSTIPTSGLASGNGVAVDAAGDVFITDQINNVVLEVTPSGVQTTLLTSGLNVPAGVAVDGAGDVFIAVNGQSRVVEVNRSLPPSLNFALTAVSNTSADSPQPISLQNVGNQPLTGTLALTLGTNFAQNPSSTCGSVFSLNPGASCSESFSFTPQTTGLLSGAAYFSDNTLNLAPSVALQAVNLNGSSSANGLAAGVIPNVVGMTQSAATTALTTAGLTLGTVTTQYSDSEPAGSVIGQNPAAGAQMNLGTAVALVTSAGVAPAPAPNPLSLLNNYFVTGDYAAAGVTLRGTGHSGMATGTINIPDSTTNPGVSQGVPDGADIIDGFLYWETLENTPSPSGNTGTFLGFPITGQQIGSDTPFSDRTLNGTLRVYRADVNTYFPVYANGSGVRYGSGAFTVSLPDSGGTGFPVTEGASLVVIYRVLSPNFPLKSVVIYDGSAVPTAATSQTVQGFYDALGGGGESTILSYASGGAWNSSYSSVPLAAHASQYSAPLNAGTAYGAAIFSTPVTNSDNDGILDVWKSGPSGGDFFAGRPGYYDVKTQSWVPLPGAQHGEKDLFVQLDYMCGAVLASGACDPSQENLFPSPDAQGNDPLAIVKNSFATIGVVLHLEIGNAVPESACTDNTSTRPAQLCEFPGDPGVVDWKNSLEISKVWPRNFASCAAGGDCTARFPYGQKDSYHYVLFGHSLAIPAWNTPYQTLTSITVASGLTTIVTANRGAPGSINYCPSRFTISGVQGNPSLNGIYNTSSCPDAQTIILSTLGVPNWTYPNNTLPEPEIGLTSGTVTSISGYSDLGGQDSAVTLGLWETAPNQNMAARANVIAGTFFHELGHTVGLTHGGRYYDTSGSYIPTYEANCKPNFQSTMNYLFQLDGVGPSASVAFSNQTLATLLPGSLGSVTQLTDGVGNPATFSTSSWYTSTEPATAESAATMHCDGTPLTGDTGYRINASIAPIPTTDAWSTGQNITFDSITNNDGVSEIEGMPYTQLRGYNDVANMDLRQVGATGGEFASLANVLSFASPATPINIAPGGNVTLGAGGTVALGSGGTATLSSGENATLSSGGTITLDSGGSVTLNNGGTVTLPASGGTIALGSGGTVALGSGGTATLSSAGTIALGSGGTVALGSGGTVTLSSGGTIALGSGGSVTIPSTGGSYTIPDSGGTVTLGSGGTVALGSGGTVALGSGGTIALGSGGTVALGSGGTVALGSGGTVALGSGGTIALGSGGNVTLGSGGTIALGSGGTIALGSGGTVVLGSGGTVALGSGGNVTIGSGGMATLGSGGTVALGSGGTVALGSGGSITLSAGGVIALGSGGTVTLGSGGTIALGSGGTIALGSGGVFTLSGGGTIALGSGGTVALGSGGTVALGSGGVIALGSGGTVALGSGGTVALGSGGTIALGSGGTVALGSGGATTNELDYDTANSIVRPPVSPSETPMPAPTGQEVVVNWTAPIFGVVQTYSVYRSSDGATPILIGSVSGANGNPPATTFTDTNPDLISTTVVYTIVTTLVPDTNGSQRSSPPSPPAVLKNNQTIVIPQPWPSSALISSSPVTLYATAESNNMANMLQVGFSASGNCSIGSQSIDSNGVSSASVTLTGTGSCTINASQTGSGSYNAADSVSGTFSILPASSNVQSQTITFPQLQNVQYGGTFSFSATASSGQTVTFSASGPCTTSGTTTGAGMCAITASAPANSTYSAASVTQSFSISPAVIKVTAASPTITYGASIPTLAYSLSGFVNNDPTSVVSGTAALSTTATATSNAGSYAITVATGTLSAANYDFLFVPGTLTIQVANQAALVLSAASPLSYNQSESLSVTGGSTGLAVSYTVTGNSGGSCSASSGQLTANSGTGSCTVSATRLGNSNYNSVSSNSVTVNLQPASQTITFTTPPPATAAYNTSFSVAATGGASGNPVTFANSGIGVCGVTPGTTPGTATYTMTNSTGTCSVTASQLGSANYSAATPVTQTVNATGPGITVSPSSVNFGSVTLDSITTQTITVSNTGSAAVTISTPLLSLLRAGNSDEFVVVNLCPSSLAAGKSCTIAVAFVAGAYYNTPQTATLKIMDNAPGSPQPVGLSAIVLEPQTITFTANPPASAAYNTSFTVGATGGASGNPVTFKSSGACSNSGATYTMTSGTGTCLVIANQAGNSNYAAAPQVTKTLTATLAAQTITFTASPPATAAYKTSFTVAATGGASGNAVTFTSSGACSNSGPTYTMTGATGTCSVIANQAGNSDYSAASKVTKTVTATLAAQTITITTSAPASAAYKTSFTVAATGGASGNAVTFTSSGACSNSGAAYTMTSGAGTCSVIANQAGNSNYAAAPQITRSVAATYSLATLSPTSMSFGTVSSGRSSTAQTATLSNTGSTPLIIGSIGFTGTNPGNFSQTNNCPSSSSSLAAGKSCSISVTFNSSGKAATASLTVTDNTQAGTQTASLSGN
ncbi:MAG: choice-of-anchor D domain-containing protein [Terracidiphilus sp.]